MSETFPSAAKPHCTSSINTGCWFSMNPETVAKPITYDKKIVNFISQVPHFYLEFSNNHLIFCQQFDYTFYQHSNAIYAKGRLEKYV